MKDVAVVDRPREKLVRAGASALGDNELVALVLGSGTRRHGALVVAQEILVAAGGAQGLSQTTLDELQRVDGVGEARAARVLAAVELGRRAIFRQAARRQRFKTPQDVVRYLLPLYGGHRIERCGVVLLDTKFRLIRTTIVSVGGQDATILEPRAVYREALLASASSVVVFHNHPSGDPRPSHDDVQATARLRLVGEAMGIELADHVILGSGRAYYSFHEAAPARHP